MCTTIDDMNVSSNVKNAMCKQVEHFMEMTHTKCDPVCIDTEMLFVAKYNTTFIATACKCCYILQTHVN